MFSVHELWKYGFIDCNSCIYQQGKVQCKRKSRRCNFCPENWDVYLNICINNLRLATEINTKQDKLYRNNSYKSISLYDDDVITSDMYYVQLVNDSLWLLRHNQTAFVFSLDHIADILRFEPDVKVTYLLGSNSFALHK